MEKAEARLPAADIYRTTGIQFMVINTLYQVLADQEQEPELVDQTTSHLMIADFFNYLFCGRAAAEVSLASTTQLLDARRRIWAVDLMQRLEMDPDAWPPVVSSGTRLGPVLAGHKAQVSGLSTPVEVVAGCSHDTACAVAAVPAEEEGASWAYLSSGTWSLLGAELKEPILTDAARAAGFTNEIGVQGTVRFLKNLTGLWVLQECEREWKEAGGAFDYDILLQEAAAAPAPDGFVDLNEARFRLRGDMPEKLNAYCRAHGLAVPATRGAVVRLILESLVEDYRQTLRVLEDLLGKRIDVLHIVGGGSRNALLCQWTADACGCRVVAGPAEATALGNLLVQAYAMGDLPEDVTIRHVVRGSSDLRVYAPR
jgi:rhamnulokinase